MGKFVQNGAEHLVDGASRKVALDAQMAEHDDWPSLPIPIFERMVQMQIEAGRSVAVAIRFTAKQWWQMGLRDDPQPLAVQFNATSGKSSPLQMEPTACRLAAV